MLAIEAPDDMNGHPFCAAGTQHGKYVNDFDFFHDARYQAGGWTLDRRNGNPVPCSSRPREIQSGCSMFGKSGGGTSKCMHILEGTTALGNQ